MLSGLARDKAPGVHHPQNLRVRPFSGQHARQRREAGADSPGFRSSELPTVLHLHEVGGGVLLRFSPGRG